MPVKRGLQLLMRSVILPEPREGEELAKTLASLQSVWRLNGVLCNCSYYLKVELEVPLDESILFVVFFSSAYCNTNSLFLFLVPRRLHNATPGLLISGHSFTQRDWLELTLFSCGLGRGSRTFRHFKMSPRLLPDVN